MANITDYIKWRGDISFEHDPLNEIDSLIFCEFTYIPFEKVLTNNKNGETIEALAKKLSELPESETKMGAIIPDHAIKELFYLAAKSVRFKDVRLKWFVDNVSKKAEKQFCAMCFVINKDYYYIAYRGTDDNIVAWKEDFNMAFNTPIPSQTEGAEYLDNIGQGTRRKLYVGGHSKGGNVATYSALFASEKTKKKIVSVHSFDGPGFRPEFLETVHDDETKAKITKYLPHGSIIGVIFDPVSECKYLKSKGKGMYQHDAFNWDVEGKGFVLEKSLAKSSVNFHDLLSSWALSMKPEEREEFVGALYKLMTANDFSTLTDIATGKVKFLFSLFKIDNKTKKILFSAVNKLIKQRRDHKNAKIQEQVPPKKIREPKPRKEKISK